MEELDADESGEDEVPRNGVRVGNHVLGLLEDGMPSNVVDENTELD